MNQLPEGTIITAERVCGVKVDGTLAADGTEVVFIQRIVIRKGRAAGAAEEFGY
jgi:hypothetical protein